MTGPLIKNTLVFKLAEIERRISEYDVQLKQEQSDLVHLRATIALFERDRRPQMDSATTMSVAGYFKRTEVYEFCVSQLERSGGSLTTSDLAIACMKAKGLDPEDKHVRRAMTQNIIQVLTVRKKEGRIVSTGKRGVVCEWSLVQ